jgi:hypothetical protein
MPGVVSRSQSRAAFGRSGDVPDAAEPGASPNGRRNDYSPRGWWFSLDRYGR